MTIEERIDRLIDAGRLVLDSDFDPTAFQNWKREAFDCLKGLLGPEHTYTLYFETFVKKQNKMNVLAGEGLLTAAREQVANPTPRC